MPRAATDRAIDHARDTDATISLDLNLRRRLWPDEVAAPVLRALAGRVDVLLGSPDELAVVTGRRQDADPSELARAASRPRARPDRGHPRTGRGPGAGARRGRPADRPVGHRAAGRRRPGRRRRRVLCRVHRRATRGRRRRRRARHRQCLWRRGGGRARRPDRAPRPQPSSTRSCGRAATTAAPDTIR